MTSTYDIIVVGAGHAGCEAAHCAATMGASVLVVTMDMEKIAAMSCNPAVGGIAKGQIVREIDALGGMMGLVTDRSAIQYRMLNRSKGPAVWSPRAQSDKRLYSLFWRQALESNPNIALFQDNVVRLVLEGGEVRGVVTQLGIEFRSRCVILTAGTFLGGRIYVGDKTLRGGRISEPYNDTLSRQFADIGFNIKQLKTGTPLRVDARTVDFGRLTEQKGDSEPVRFSYLNDGDALANPMSCWIAYTNSRVHEALSAGFDRSPLFTGRIQGVGPRYCPSIEDKIVTFADKQQHQLFLEPEGRDTCEYYLNGFSSSLPWEVQYNALRLIPGFERCRIFRPGYAIEYDYFDPTQLKATLESKLVPNLFFAGQVNGTTGYEEAACQGLVAGVNAVRMLRCETPFVLRRNEAYIGVLIDDLVYKGVNDPYRMFTSRAEYRILLRQDNADERLTAIGHNLGLATDERLRRTEEKYERVGRYISFCDDFGIRPEIANPLLAEKQSSPLSQSIKASKLLLRPEIEISDLSAVIPFPESISDTELDSASVRIKYQGYIDKERMSAEKINKFYSMRIPTSIDFSTITSISTEGRIKLSSRRPETIGEAISISGVNPSDILILLSLIGR